MKKTMLNSGRVNQKLRTRKALLQAAYELMETHGSFTLEDVAQKAMVSRATVYRYFSDVDTLKMETSLDIQTKSPEQVLFRLENASASQRMTAVQRYLFELTKKNETSFRNYLSAVLKLSAISSNNGANLRGARRVPMIEAALEPYKAGMNEDTYTKLVHLMAVLVGVESYIVLKDVCNLKYAEAATVMQWGIEKLITAVLQE
jgi:AcrR family transcriptional regulator